MELAEWHMWWKRRGAHGLRRFLNEWDPIGVEGSGVEDEYDSYLGPLAERLRAGAGPNEIAAYLRDVRSDRMGLGDWPEWDRREREIAGRIKAWYAEETAP